MDRARHKANALPSYLGNTARNQKRIRLVVKRRRSSGVLCVAVWHENDQTLPRARDHDRAACKCAHTVDHFFKSATGQA